MFLKMKSQILIQNTEKSMYNELYAMENTILTPHIAGWTFQSKEKIAEVLFNKIVEFVS